jgi:D-serine deaminase-like pyridoxal phosphate-dependent protein
MTSMTATPRLLLDESRLERNIARMAERVRTLGGAFRPHVKTHKSAELARRQLDAGAVGVTVATVREGQVMADAGVGDILLAYPPIGEVRIEAIARLAQRCRLTVVCSEHAHVEALAARGLAVGFYWEVDCGTGRLGSEPGAPSAAAIERAVALGVARFAGLMAFAGHAYGVLEPARRRDVAAQERDALSATAAELERRGIDPGTLSVGSTPLAAVESPYATEFRFGNYVFYDATQVALGSATLDDCALSVEATVIGRPADDRVILDAGSKALAAERMSGATATFGLVRGYPGLQVAQLYEEHAICRADPGTPLPRLGERVEVVPNHACTCANLHAAYHLRGAAGERRLPLDARGWDDIDGP